MQTRWKSSVDAAKLDDLRQMQGIALALLLTMAVLLAATSFSIAAHPWTAWVKAFAEAAVVGAVADWFAVVALFRRPLGLPIAHTAIIPNNKDRIGESLGRFVEENFLTPENVMQRLALVNIAKAGGTWLAEPANSERAAAGICAMVPRVLTMFQDEDVTRFLTRTLLGELEKVNLSRVAGEALDLVTSGEQYHALFDDAIKGIERLIADNQALILEKFGEASKYTPEFFDRYVVDRFVRGIARLLQEVIADPQHPLRIQFNDSTRKLNEWLQGALETLMLAHRRQISLLITDVVKSWDAREVSEKIELEIGKDLQYIRLNGTLVGGCVGVLLHLLAMLPGYLK